ncbi:hypothetical protein TNCT_318901 [Trichonephila clavata]|uniref:Uncharacterized protein n=1 Tax=Trichonephila clavata TaxID=2740835 RepID=A0A8X6LFN1_TRICU|nr:hypothetical protein TNCT_318901 [Trichonephila clavata]
MIHPRIKWMKQGFNTGDLSKAQASQSRYVCYNRAANGLKVCPKRYPPIQEREKKREHLLSVSDISEGGENGSSRKASERSNLPVVK